MKNWVIIPAYNEADNLGKFLTRIKEKNLSILVVDDGSVDNTYQVAKRYADIVIKNQRNFGKGLSLRKGIGYLINNKYFDCIITMDADSQHSPDDLDKFIQEAKQGSLFVIGNRMKNSANMPKARVITNYFMSWLISKIVRQRIPDSQCGYRLIKREVIEKLTIRTKKFEIESEILINASKLGYLIKSIPIKTIYHKNTSSKIKPISDAFRFIKFILRVNNG
ncbi:MAG: glycosyltransferase family 2 protein [Candidatus Omnitrophica bacterium]|nr:glycosyltransferase family 2 protein [Candidatus Omnitrophota bacterium]MCF7892330.1 glycosyltransferase family 2 protein [Candidatus Omnitrophota bacterium]MCF7896208.1 glycosyltransferase family 2 protein [Candidatus Omnitrophota bacterium]MCF7897857.1 glycosyltransferase family 2 protein [Candidatus Omnitrophota bacterium]MCF7909139.1 glycosyltransferase family 2 protein [Candidatus Omnitrophota bacterium]